MNRIKPFPKLETAMQTSPFPVFFLLLALLLAPQSGFAADIAVSVDRNPTGIDESFQITFSANESPDDDPDFSPLEQDFSIIDTRNSTSLSLINGKSGKTLQWTVNVMAKQAGKRVIPAIKFGKDASKPLPILVTEGKPTKAVDTNEDLFMEVEATPENPYVQSQVFYTMRLYTKVDVSQARLNEPEPADAVIEKLGEDSTYTTEVNGVGYSVTERKYAIFPQKSGRLTIKPLVLNAEVLTSSRPSFNGFFNSQMTKTQRVESKAITLNVRPEPPSFTGKHWLPAQQVDLKQKWSGDIHQMKVGEPLTRTLTLEAKGTTVGQLPELNNTITNDRLKAYPDQPVLQEQKKVDGLQAFREEKIALIPSKADSYTLPAVEIPWFNTETQKMEIARIPETTLTATGVAETQPAPIAPAAAPTVMPPTIASAQAVASPQAATLWPWVSLFLGCGWLITVIFFLAKRTVAKPVIEVDEQEINLKTCSKRLKNACADNDAAAAKNALLEWGRQKFGVTNLGALARFCDARLRDEILYLNQALYGKETSGWQGKKLFQTFTENKARRRIAVVEDKSLEPLYRL